MTQDDVIEMARDSGMELYGLGKNRARFVHHLEAFANLVAAKEREECAKILEVTDLSGLKDNPSMQKWVAEMLLAYANAIRARGEQA